MTARQTIIHVRGGRTDLSSEVASLLPSQIAQAHRSIRQEKHRGTSFCPICGQNKTKSAMRCGACRDIAMRATGHRSGAARSRISEAITRDNPSHGDPKVDGPTWSHRAKGSGKTRVQPWRRMVLLDGKWVAEVDTPEGQEIEATTDDALRRLAEARP